MSDKPDSARPRRPARPVPERPPDPVVLPATDPDAFSPPPELDVLRERFNLGDYRGCVEPIEALYFARRNTFHQGLLQYVVALLQLRLGLVATPRKLLGQALELWAPYPCWQEGLRLDALATHARALLQALPEARHSAPPEDISRWWIAPPRL